MECQAVGPSLHSTGICGLLESQQPALSHSKTPLSCVAGTPASAVAPNCCEAQSGGTIPLAGDGGLRLSLFLQVRGALDINHCCHISKLNLQIKSSLHLDRMCTASQGPVVPMATSRPEARRARIWQCTLRLWLGSAQEAGRQALAEAGWGSRR